ncbi:MAG: DUF2155 domain-containing protein [Rhodospirillales bacterium]|jgi:hypothetical protein
MSWRKLVLTAACTFWVSPSLAEYISMPGAVIQGLDKITARVSELSILNGNETHFGGLIIKVTGCHNRPPEEPPEAAAFLEIIDDKTKSGTTLFRGWMFASSPAISPLEHPVYDIRVLRCIVQ